MPGFALVAPCISQSLWSHLWQWLVWTYWAECQSNEAGVVCAIADSTISLSIRSEKMAAGFFNGLAETLSITILYLSLLEITAVSSVQLHFSAFCNSAGNRFETTSLASGIKNNGKKSRNLSVSNTPFSLLSSNKWHSGFLSLIPLC